MPQPQPKNRAQVQLVDIFMTVFVLIGIVVLAPFFYKFIGMISAQADSFSGLLLQLMVPLLIIALIISVGVSARRGGI